MEDTAALWIVGGKKERRSSAKKKEGTDCTRDVSAKNFESEWHNMGGGGGGRNSYKGRVRGEHSEGITTKKEKNVGRKNQ